MNDVLKKVLNRGAPIETPILISLLSFFYHFKDEQIIDEYRKSTVEICSKLSNIMDMYAGNTVFPIFVTIKLNDDNSKVLAFSAENYVGVILELFNKHDDIFELFKSNDKQVFYRIKEKMLKIKDSNELKSKYPRLHELYLEQLECNKNLLELDKVLKDKTVDFKEKLGYKIQVTKNFTELYSDFNLEREIEYAKDFTLTKYLERIFKGLENWIDNAEEIMNIYSSYEFNLDCFSKEEADKLNLYMANEYLKKVEDNDTEDKQRYLFYLTNYFKENVETKVTYVKMKLDDRKVNPIILYERYKKVLVNNPELLTVNFSPLDFKNMNREEVEEFIIAYMSELSANWELIPHDDTSVDKIVRKTVSRKFRNISEEERKARQKKLLDLYMTKKNFFDSTDPYFRVKGKQTFDGYVGYIYSNSIVVLEKFYEDVENTKVAKNEAIYIMTMKDFYDLSQHSKTYLMANHLCIRVYHRGEWQKRVLDYIKGNIMANPVADTNKLIEENKVVVKEKKNI